MSVSEKIKSAAAAVGVPMVEAAKRMEVTKAALANKLQRGSFSTDDTIRIASALGLRLALIDDQGRIITEFYPEDAAPPRKSGAASTKADQPEDQTKE